MTQVLEPILAVCRRHADRLRWAMQQLSVSVPFDAQRLAGLSDMDLAVLDQFTGRFARLLDVMGQSLFPAVLDRAHEPGDLSAFLDKLARLEKIGVIASADEWIRLRELRNAFAQDYPDDPAVQAAILNRAIEAARSLLAILDGVVAWLERQGGLPTAVSP